VAEIVTDAVVSADSHGSVIYVNKGGERLFGWEASQLAGRPLTVLVPERFHESTRRGLLRYISIEPAEAFGNVVELIALHKDGHEFPIEISLARWEDGPARFFTAIVRDITERKRRDEELRDQRTARGDEPGAGDLQLLSVARPARPCAPSTVQRDSRAGLR
jgi:PAS domain S-box-containing protein